MQATWLESYNIPGAHENQKIQQLLSSNIYTFYEFGFETAR